MAKKPYRPAVHVLARNIRATYDAATPLDVLQGRTWYDAARAAAVALDPHNVERAAGILAALSPQQTWQGNLAAAAAIYAGEAPTFATGPNIAKARAIHDGGEPLDVLGGPKVRAFYANIVGDPNVVTIDRHAVDAARGRRGAYATHNTSSVHVHAAFVEAYRRVAAEVGETPANLQAIVWVTWRRQHDTASHRADAAAVTA